MTGGAGSSKGVDASPVTTGSTSATTASQSSATLETKCLFQCNESVRKLAPGAEDTVTFHVTPMEVGKHALNLIVRNLTHKCDAAVTVVVSAKQQTASAETYLSMPDLEGDLLDVKDCYMQNNKFMKVVPFRLVGRTSTPLSIGIRSNLSNQVLIFSDSALQVPADAITLTAGANETTVFVCVASPVESRSSEPKKADKGKQLDSSHLFQVSLPLPPSFLTHKFIEMYELTFVSVRVCRRTEAANVVNFLAVSE